MTLSISDPKVKEFTSGAEIIAAARALRNKFRAPAAPPPRPRIVERPVVQPSAPLSKFLKPEPVAPAPALIKLEAGNFSIGSIQRRFEHRLGLPAGFLLSVNGRGHHREFSRLRQACVALCYELTMKSRRAIGRHFGGLDHWSAMHASKALAPVLQYLAADGAVPLTTEAVDRFIDIMRHVNLNGNGDVWSSAVEAYKAKSPCFDATLV